jgi:flagellar hook-associated protein FlgK
LKALRDELARNDTFAEAMQTRLNSLQTDFVNRDDPAQRSVIERNRQKVASELNRLKQSITDGKKAIADLEEEARRAGVPPGWLR